MTHQPPPGQPYPPQQPYGPWGPPPPKKPMNGWAIAGITVASLFVVLVIVGLLAGDPDTTDNKAGAKRTPTAEAPAAQPSKAAPAKKSAAPAEEPADDAPVKVSAKTAKFTPSVLHDGGAFTSVEVTIVNNGDEKISVNPLYFTIVDTTGSKHKAQLGEDERQIDTMDLSPGERTTGIITGEGKFSAKYVTYTDGLFGDEVRGKVS